MATAWLREIEESDDEGHAMCTGRFECRLGERATAPAARLPLAEAVAWAREHADRAFVDVEGERYELPALPPEVAARLAGGPRRPRADEGRDRPADAPPMRWEIVVTLKPPDLTAEGRAAGERVVERVAGRLAAAGCDEIAWSSDELDAAPARIDAQWRRAGKPEELGWMTTGLMACVLSAAAEAPAHRPLRERVRAAVVAEAEGRWRVVVDVHPPGYTWRPPLL